MIHLLNLISCYQIIAAPRHFHMQIMINSERNVKTIKLNGMVNSYITCILNLQCPTEDLKDFVTTDGLPFIHFVLRESANNQIDKTVNFLHNVPDIELLCSVVNRDGHKAGHCFPDEAHKILCAGCRQGSMVTVSAMLDAGAEIDRFDDNALSPLMWAAKHGHIDIIQTLIQYKASLGLCNINNENSLLTACKSLQWEAAQMLFDCGVDALCADKEQNSAVSVALASHAVDLLKHMAEKYDTILTMLKEAISLPDVCKFGYDMLLVFHNTDSLPKQEIHALVYEACSTRQTQILTHFSEMLDDVSLTVFITHAYKAGHYDCRDVFLQSAQNRFGYLSCPEILLSEACKRAECINLIKNLLVAGNNEGEGKGEPLRVAAEFDNLAAVKCLLRHHAEADIADKNGFTPLLHACQNKNLKIVNELLAWGADVNFSGEETPLTMACKVGDIEVLNRLLSKRPKPDLNQPNNQGMTPFEVAVDNINPVVAMAILENGARPVFKRLPFQKLCQIGSIDLVNRYLQSCTTDQSTDSSSLDILVRCGNVQLVNFLLENTKVTKTFEALVQTLKTACIVGTLDIVKILIQYNDGKFWQSVNDPHFLQLAFEHQHIDIVVFLLNHGCELLTENIPWKAVISSKQILDLLMKHDLSQACLNQALIAACRSDDRNAEYAVRLLLEKSADIHYCDSIDPDHVTPLLIACQKSSVSLVKLLLNKGANPNHCDINGKTPLFIASELEHMELASLLIYDGNANPDFPSMSVEKRPLWEACMKGHLDIALLMLEHGANPNLRDEEGCWLLFKAHSNGQLEIVRLMLESQANPLALYSLTLNEACQYGYAEYALQIYHYSDSCELIEGFEVASKYDFDETALGIIINILDKETQMHYFAAWHDKSQTSLDKSLTSDTTSIVISSTEGNPLWQCYANNDTDAMIELLKKGHNPNIKNTYGKPLLHLWIERKNRRAVQALCECPIFDITQKDHLGRNALFYVLDWFVSEGEICMYDYLKAKGAEVVPDKFGRTILHEWKEENDGNKRGLSLEKFLEDIPDINVCDHKNQTPLHVAVFRNNFSKVCKLLEKGNDPKFEDVNKISPLILARENAAMYKIFTDRCPDVEPLAHIPQKHGDKEKMYFSKEHHIDQRVPSAIYKLFCQTNHQNAVSLFKTQFEESILISRAPQFKHEFKDFKRSVQQFMTYLGHAIGKDDPLFEFSPTMSGSCSEATKVIAMDEADVLCIFKHPDWKTLVLKTHEKNNFSFMKLESESLSQKQPQMFNGTNLSVHGVFARFYTLVRKHAAEALKYCKNLYIKDVHAILPNDCSICPLELVWSGKMLCWQEFDVDIVPAIPVAKIPRELKYHYLVHDLVIVPKWTSSLIQKSYADEAFQLGFSNTEKDFFYGMPVALREAYKLAKVAVHNCMVIDDIKAGNSLSSYMLKCKAFECFAEMPGFFEKVTNPEKRELLDDEASHPIEVLHWADRLLAKVEYSVKRHQLESFFLGYNLLGQASYRPLLYTPLCRAMLHIPSENIKPWTQLAEAIADHLVTPQNLNPGTFVQEVNMLLEMGLHVNYKPKNTAPILFYMIKNDLLVGVKSLLAKRASVDDMDGKGKTAMHLAEENKCTDILHHLEEHVAGTVY